MSLILQNHNLFSGGEI